MPLRAVNCKEPVELNFIKKQSLFPEFISPFKFPFVFPIKYTLSFESTVRSIPMSDDEVPNILVNNFVPSELYFIRKIS